MFQNNLFLIAFFQLIPISTVPAHLIKDASLFLQQASRGVEFGNSPTFSKDQNSVIVYDSLKTMRDRDNQRMR